MAASSSASIVLPSIQALQSREQMLLLNAVDALRAQKLDGITYLPQLVVSGDQSSGKSSVLEALSGIPFPKKTNLCTRFATEVILRRESFVRMTISIVPSEDHPVQDLERIKGFRHDLVSIDGFESLFEEAKRTMGISDQRKNFSKDVLRIEFCGPNQPQLTLVDLPGLFHSEMDGQTSGDVKLVDDLVMEYLKNERSIILAIVSARYDVNIQAILSRARKVDPEGKRTLGIITKPDTITTSEEERTFLKIARNEDVEFALGWHVVKNMPSGVDVIQQQSRDENETEFFNTNSTFSRLPKGDVGIASLRARLSSVLFDHIKRELPNVIEEIETKTRIANAVIHGLGPARSSLDEQKIFLIQLSESFQSICRDAVAGHYDHDFFREDNDEEKRLCATLMNKHYRFARNLQRDGASWKIIHQDDELNEVCSEITDESGDYIDHERKRSRKEAIEAACNVLKRNRGRELPGLPNPLLVGELFREYSRPWADIAEAHITDVWYTTKKFLDTVLKYIAGDEVGDKILRHWLDKIMDESLNLAKKKLNELVDVHKDHPFTTNDDFVNNRTEIQERRTRDHAQTDMDLVAAEDAFDNMNAYYKVAMNLFMDNVPSLAIQSPIIRKLPSMFSPSATSRMDSDTIRKIAGESEANIRIRDDTLHELAILKEGARICKEHASRPRSVPRPVEKSAHIAAKQSPVGVRREAGKGSSIRKRHSPSVSEDGRATSQANEQGINLTASWFSSDKLPVPGDDPIRRPVSSNSLFGATSTSSTLKNAANKSTSAGLGSSPATSLFGLPLHQAAANTTKTSTGIHPFQGLNSSKTPPIIFGQPSTPISPRSTGQVSSPIFGTSSKLSNPNTSTNKIIFGNPDLTLKSSAPTPTTSNQVAEEDL